MCGRFAADLDPSQLRAYFGLLEAPPVQPRYNVAPGQMAAVIRSEGDHNRLDLLKWGLVPEGSPNQAIGSHLINAWAENVAEKQVFRHALKYRRCIVPASGYYEWEITREQGKQPYFVHLVGDEPMPLAGLWELWKAPDGSFLETFTIVTTTANRLLAPLHERMPVILQSGDFSLWLSKNMHDPQQVRSLFQPYPAERMRRFRVSDLVNDPHVDSPMCCIPL